MVTFKERRRQIESLKEWDNFVRREVDRIIDGFRLKTSQKILKHVRKEELYAIQRRTGFKALSFGIDPALVMIKNTKPFFREELPYLVFVNSNSDALNAASYGISKLRPLVMSEAELINLNKVEIRKLKTRRGGEITGYSPPESNFQEFKDSVRRYALEFLFGPEGVKKEKIIELAKQNVDSLPRARLCSEIQLTRKEIKLLKATHGDVEEAKMEDRSKLESAVDGLIKNGLIDEYDEANLRNIGILEIPKKAEEMRLLGKSNVNISKEIISKTREDPFMLELIEIYNLTRPSARKIAGLGRDVFMKRRKEIGLLLDNEDNLKSFISLNPNAFSSSDATWRVYSSQLRKDYAEFRNNVELDIRILPSLEDVLGNILIENQIGIEATKKLKKPQISLDNQTYSALRVLAHNGELKLTEYTRIGSKIGCNAANRIKACVGQILKWYTENKDISEIVNFWTDWRHFRIYFADRDGHQRFRYAMMELNKYIDQKWI